MVVVLIEYIERNELGSPLSYCQKAAMDEPAFTLFESVISAHLNQFGVFLFSDSSRLCAINSTVPGLQRAGGRCL